MGAKEIIRLAAVSVGIPADETEGMEVIVKRGSKPLVNFVGGPPWKVFFVGFAKPEGA